MQQSPKTDLRTLCNLIQNRVPFTFVRFSDGEMEVIANSKLVIAGGAVEWRGGKNPASYPVFDTKTFLPERDQEFRRDLLESSRFRAPNFFKGIRTNGSLAVRDKKKMLELNGDLPIGLTFADLLINENWGAFRHELLPLILAENNVIFFGNFRAKPDLLSSTLSHIPIGDDFISTYRQTLGQSMTELTKLPRNAIVLSSASSLTNIVGHRLHLSRPDLTLIDIGTAINPFIGLEDGLREYHSQLLPWTVKNFKKKALYYALGSHNMRW